MRVILSHVPRWWPLAVLAVPALGYTLFRSDQLQYWDGAVGNLVATLLGIIAGVPVALHLERRRAANDAEEKRSEEIRIKREILTLLREELENNLSRLQHRASLDNAVIPDPLKMSIWEALRDSGSLKYISEPNLISDIADFYRLLMIINNREEHLIQLMYGAGASISFPDGEIAPKKFLRMVNVFYSPALVSGQTARTSIDKALQH